MKSLFAVLSVALLAVSLSADEPKPAVEGQKAGEKTPAALPETLHGFAGTVQGTVVSKDVERATVTIKVQQVPNVWKVSKAAKPQDLVGRSVTIDKLFGRFLDVLLIVKEGDTVLIGARHVRGDQLQFPGELFKKVEAVESPKDAEKPKEEKPAKSDKVEKPAPAEGAGDQFPEGLKGFRGMFVGKVVSTDKEKGVLVFQVESIKNIWKQNKAKDPASSTGKTLTVNGIAGKWLDVLLVLKPGDRIEVEAFHNRGEALDFVQEWLKKVD